MKVGKERLSPGKLGFDDERELRKPLKGHLVQTHAPGRDVLRHPLRRTQVIEIRLPTTERPQGMNPEFLGWACSECDWQLETNIEQNAARAAFAGHNFTDHFYGAEMRKLYRVSRVVSSHRKKW